MKFLITGGAGFFGSNLSKKVLEQDDELIIFDSLSRNGSQWNIDWLKSYGGYDFIHGDIRNNNDVEEVIKRYKPDVVFHTAGQVAMTTSIQNPLKDFETNAVGTVNLLENIRKFSAESIIIYSSTNKVYGDLNQYHYEDGKTRYICEEFPLGFPEHVPLDFRTPYGISKGTADQYVLEYSRSFGLQTAVFRHSSLYGERQFATADQGWVGWFTQKAIDAYKDNKIAHMTISGSGKQVRDILHVDDAVRLYFQAISDIDKINGKEFNIGGGFSNSFSLLELFSFLEKKMDVKIVLEKLSPRPSDQKIFIADISKIKTSLEWEPTIRKEIGITKMIEWLHNEKTQNNKIR